MKKIAYFLAFFHLALITTVIFHGVDSFIFKGWWEKPMTFLCSINYSVWRYGFFSPDVGKSTEVKIRVFEDGREGVEYSTLHNFRFYTANQESLNRFYGFKHNTAQDSVFQDLCARSVAARMLNIHERAWRIDYITRSIHYPPIRKFRPLVPVDTVEFYSTTFVLQ